MLIIFTGNGKGKTTAALGQALRSVGNGKRVLMVQFIKGPWKSGEDVSFQKLEPNFKIEKMGKGFVGIGGDLVPFHEHKKAARNALLYVRREIQTGRWDIVILDEVNVAVKLRLVSQEEVAEFIDYSKKQKIEDIIFTGRDAPQEFIEQADLVTEMREVKHPFRAGIKGRKGLEY